MFSKVSSILVFVLLLIGTAHAAPVMTLGPVVMNNAIISFPLVLKQDNALISGLAVDVVFSSDRLFPIRKGATLSSVLLGAAVSGKTLSQSLEAENILRLTVIGQNNNSPIADGVVANVSFGLVPGADLRGVTFQMSLEGTDPSGNPVQIISSIPARIAGDMTAKGYLESGDALLVMQTAVGAVRLTTDQRTFADVNGDGRIDVGDAITILARVVGI